MKAKKPKVTNLQKVAISLSIEKINEIIKSILLLKDHELTECTGQYIAFIDDISQFSELISHYDKQMFPRSQCDVDMLQRKTSFIEKTK